MKRSLVCVALIALSSAAFTANAACVPTSEEVSAAVQEQTTILAGVDAEMAMMQNATEQAEWFRSAKAVVKNISLAGAQHNIIGRTAQYCAKAEQFVAQLVAQVKFLKNGDGPEAELTAYNNVAQVAVSLGVPIPGDITAKIKSLADPMLAKADGDYASCKSVAGANVQKCIARYWEDRENLEHFGVAFPKALQDQLTAEFKALNPPESEEGDKQ